MQLMTSEQYFNFVMNRYPSLFSSSNIDIAKLKIFDHVFNTIGNGMNDFQSFQREITITSKNHNLLHDFPKEYIIDEESSEFSPYPNFNKEYSIAWKGLENFDKSWIYSAIWYYSQIKEFFKSDNLYNYHYAHPKNDDDSEWQKLIFQFENSFAYLKKENMSDSDFYNLISTNYQMPYNGDTKQFIKDRWTKELSRIHLFLDETIDMLQQSLQKKQKLNKY